MGGIEDIVRDAEAERRGFNAQQVAAQNKRLQEMAAQSVQFRTEAIHVLEVLGQCDQILQSLYNKSSRSMKDRICIPKEQIQEAMTAIRQVYRGL
jgi:hypothetical protein